MLWCRSKVRLNKLLNRIRRTRSLKEKGKARNVSHKRLLDCKYYSRCLMEAARSCSSSRHFSCAMCESYKQEKASDEDRILETIRALKLVDAVCKDGETGWVRV